MRGILNVCKISKKFPKNFQSSSHRHEVTAKAYFGTKSINIFMLIYYTLMYHTSLWYFSKNIIYLKPFNTVYSLLLYESEPVSDHPYLQIQAQAKRHLLTIYVFIQLMLKCCVSLSLSQTIPISQIQAQAKRHLINYLCVHPIIVIFLDFETCLWSGKDLVKV